MSALDRTIAPAEVAPNVRRGMLLMVAGLALFSLLNGLVKALAETFPISQIIFFRNLFALATLLAMAPGLGGFKALRPTDKGGLALQAVQFTAVLFFIFVAYRHMPLADATAISFLQPLLVVLLSAPFLGERVTPSGWIGVALGFAGVMLMMRPTGTASAFGVSMALIGTVFSALSLLQQRNLSRGATSIAIAFWTLGGSALLIAPALLFDWVTPTPAQWAWLIGNGLASGACQYLTTRALYHAPVGAVAPLNYTKMVWAMLVGFAWFGDVPTFGMLIGSAAVILAGLIVYREHR
jgi:drug/metabolite transporter (DMT)-like permease